MNLHKSIVLAMACLCIPATLQSQDTTLVVSPETLSPAIIRDDYSQQITVSGGVAPYEWTVAGLPAGFTTSNGGNSLYIAAFSTSVEAAAVGAPYSLRVIVRDASSPRNRGGALYDLEIMDALPLSVDTPELAPAIANVEYQSEPFVPVGGVGYDRTWQVEGLPDGLDKVVLTNGNMRIEGTVNTLAAENSPYTLTITVTDEGTPEESFDFTAELTVELEPLQVVPFEFPSPTAGYDISPIQLEVVEGTDPFTFSVSGLPQGLTFNALSNTIEGAASFSSIGETYTVFIEAHDNGTPARSGTYEVQTVVLEPLNVQVIGSTTGFIEEPFTLEIVVLDSPSQIVWSNVEDLPSGLSLNARGRDRAEITGTPDLSAASTDPYTVTCTIEDLEDEESPRIGTLEVDLYILQRLRVLNGSFPVGVVGQDYESELKESGGRGPYHWESSPLPDGLQLSHNANSNEWTIDGVIRPEARGAHTIRLSVADSHEPRNSSVAYVSLLILNPEQEIPLSISTSYLPAGQEGDRYDSVELLATGGAAPYDWSQTVGLPGGLEIQRDNDQRSFVTRTEEPLSPGTWLVQLVVVDSNREAASAIFPLIIQPAEESENIQTESLLNGFDSGSLLIDAPAGSCSLSRTNHFISLVSLLLLLPLLVCVRAQLHITAWNCFGKQ